MKVFFYTLGCKVNQYETEAMSESFKNAGYTVITSDNNPDVIVVNSCTVTANSDFKTRQVVRHLRHNNPDSLIVLTGCMPQAYPEKAAELSEVDIVTGNKDHSLVLSLVKDHFENKELENRQILSVEEHKSGDAFENSPITEFTGRTRAFVKIQDGCNRFCSYCIIPTARGRSRSRSLEDLKVELENVKKAGFKEVVLVGINLCCYGLDIGKRFTDAVELACDMGFDRVRLGSLEFDNITPDAVKILASYKNFCPQFHMSLQSGCDKTLNLMNRHYTTAEYEALCRNLRENFEDATITTDMMVGFPSESDEDFNESMAFAKKIGFEKIHVFPYSRRTGTKAAELGPQVTNAVKDARAHKMIETAKEIRIPYLKSQIGKTVEILCENHIPKMTATKLGSAIVTGYTKNYTPVKFSSDVPRQNELVTLKIIGVDELNEYCIGEEL